MPRGPAASPRLEDLALVRAARAGRAEAIAELEERLRFVPRVLAVLNRRLGRTLSDHDLEDVTQDVLSRVWPRLDGYSGHARLETWLYPFCVNVLRNARRKAARRERDRVDVSKVPESSAPPPAPASDFAHVHDAVDRLGPPRSDVVRAHLFEGRTFAEISERMDVPVATVKTWFYRAVASLRDALAREEEE